MRWRCWYHGVDMLIMQYAEYAYRKWWWYQHHHRTITTTQYKIDPPLHSTASFHHACVTPHSDQKQITSQWQRSLYTTNAWNVQFIHMYIYKLVTHTLDELGSKNVLRCYLQCWGCGLSSCWSRVVILRLSLACVLFGQSWSKSWLFEFACSATNIYYTVHN